MGEVERRGAGVAHRGDLIGAPSRAGGRPSHRGVGQALDHQAPQGRRQLAQPGQSNLVAVPQHGVNQLIEDRSLLAQDLGQGQDVSLGSGVRRL